MENAHVLILKTFFWCISRPLRRELDWNLGLAAPLTEPGKSHGAWNLSGRMAFSGGEKDGKGEVWLYLIPFDTFLVPDSGDTPLHGDPLRLKWADGHGYSISTSGWLGDHRNPCLSIFQYPDTFLACCIHKLESGTGVKVTQRSSAINR